MGTPNSYQESKEHVKLNLAILEKEGTRFEVAVDCDKAVQFKEGQDINIKDILESEHIFTDCQKGMMASDTRLEAVFGTKDPLEIAKIIIQDGRIQLTAEHRERIREQKRARILDRIATKAIDPKTKLPHPLERIKLAMEEAKVRIDEFQPVDRQLKDIIKKLQPVLPITFESVAYKVEVPGAHVGPAQPAARKYGTIESEEYGNDGSWTFTTKCEGVEAQKLMDELNSVTHGNVNFTKL